MLSFSLERKRTKTRVRRNTERTENCNSLKTLGRRVRRRGWLFRKGGLERDRTKDSAGIIVKDFCEFQYSREQETWTVSRLNFFFFFGLMLESLPDSSSQSNLRQMKLFFITHSDRIFLVIKSCPSVNFI